MFKSTTSTLCLVLVWFATLCEVARTKNLSSTASHGRMQALNVTTRSQVSFISGENCQKELVCRVDADTGALQRVLDISILEKTTNTVLKRVSSIYYLKSRKSNLDLGDTVETRSGINRENGSLVVRKILPINTGFGGEDFVCKVVYVDSSLRIQSVESNRAGETHDTFCKIPNLLKKLDSFDRKFRRLSVAEAEGNVCLVPDMTNAMSSLDSKLNSLLNVCNKSETVKSKLCNQSVMDNKLVAPDTDFSRVDKNRASFYKHLSSMSDVRKDMEDIGRKLNNLPKIVNKLEHLEIKMGEISNTAFNLSERVSISKASDLVSRPGVGNETVLKNFEDVSSCDSLRDPGQGHEIPPRPIIKWLNGVKVVCDTQTSGGGWTVIQRRFHGHLNFNRGWEEYEGGFGDIDGEFWLGLKHIRNLVKSWDHELRIDMRSKGLDYYAHYSHFMLSHARFNYSLSVGGFSGTVGRDSMAYHNTRPFSTFDRDNDESSGNCAKSYSGGWWWGHCSHSALNMIWSFTDPRGVEWSTVTSSYHRVTFTEMKVRRK